MRGRGRVGDERRAKRSGQARDLKGGAMVDCAALECIGPEGDAGRMSTKTAKDASMAPNARAKEIEPNQWQ